MLPAYRESLYQRYPPVCESCLPQVEEEIRQKDHMARVQALGASLSKGKQRQRRVSGPDPAKEAQMNKALYWWRIRGCLWAAGLCISLYAHISGMCDPYYPASNSTHKNLNSHVEPISISPTIIPSTYPTAPRRNFITMDCLGSHILFIKESQTSRSSSSDTRQIYI
jgi:hypothetical protein